MNNDLRRIQEILKQWVTLPTTVSSEEGVIYNLELFMEPKPKGPYSLRLNNKTVQEKGELDAEIIGYAITLYSTGFGYKIREVREINFTDYIKPEVTITKQSFLTKIKNWF